MKQNIARGEQMMRFWIHLQLTKVYIWACALRSALSSTYPGPTQQEAEMWALWVAHQKYPGVPPTEKEIAQRKRWAAWREAVKQQEK